MQNEPESIVNTLHAGVRVLRMNRAEKKNALNAAMYVALTQALRAAETDAAVRAVLICGTAGVFTAGNDLQAFLAPADPVAPRPAHALLEALAASTVPLVAAVDGPAVGIGTTLLLHCDFVCATPDARLSLPFVNLGVCPEAGSSLLLPRLIGYARAAELLMLGETFDGRAAFAAGIVTRLCEPTALYDEALGIARKLADKPRAALRATKALMKRAEEPLQARIEAEIGIFSDLLTQPAACEIMTAFVEKRAPVRSRYE
jgi:enoyl-CoA hydratase/carnithine racemase